MTMKESRRVSLFIDGSNFFYLQKDHMGWWANPLRIMEWVENHIGPITDAFYYIGIKGEVEDSGQNQYIEALVRMGFCVRSKTVRVFKNAEGEVAKSKANLDIEIVIDAFNYEKRYDTMVLLSGDGDFSRMIEVLEARGKECFIMSSDGFVARALREIVGRRFIDLRDIRAEIEKEQYKPAGPERLASDAMAP